jgi:N utilization substance protein B
MKSEATITTTGRRTESRIAAVKALYAGEINEKIDNRKSPALLALDIIALYNDIEKDNTLPNLDEKFVTEVITGVCENLGLLDKKIESHLGDEWKLERLGPVIRSILRAAIYELMKYTDTPFKVIINEYVNITRSFFDEKEVGFVNGILDKISHEVRG